MSKVNETIIRSLVKTIIWRVTVFIADFIIAFVFTKDVDLSTKLALTKVFVSFVLYYLHERVWNKISWGRG